MYHNRPVSWVSRWRTSRRFRATARVIDHVVAGNEYLVDIFRKEGKPVTVLPTVVDPFRYQIKQHTPTGSPRLVWIGSRSTLPGGTTTPAPSATNSPHPPHPSHPNLPNPFDAHSIGRVEQHHSLAEIYHEMKELVR